MNLTDSRLLTFAARVGYGARGVVYLLIGIVAALAALDLAGHSVGTRGALRLVFAQPLGGMVIAAFAGGFGCFAAWRMTQALLDPTGYGRDMKGIGIRVALGASAIAYAGVTAFAVGLLLDWEAVDPARHRSTVVDWVTSLMTAPYGPWMAAAAGLAVVALGVAKIVKAWRAEFNQHLDCGARIRLWAVPVSRFGLTARGVIFALIGASLITAGLQVQADRAAGLAGVLRALEHLPLGWVLLATAALGLASFGVFGLLEAMYRRIDARDID